MSDEYAVTRRFTVGSVLSTTFGVLSRNLAGFVLLAVVAIGASILLQWSLGLDLWGRGSDSAMINLIDTLATSMLTGMVAYGTFRDLRGDRAGVGAIVGRGLRLIVPIFVVGVLISLLVGIGFAFFVIPGLILWTAFWVTIPAAVVERCGIFAAFGRSRTLTRGYRWHVLGLVLLIHVPLTVLIFAVAASADGLEDFGKWDTVAFTVVIILGGFVSLFAGVGAAVSYFQLREIKEGIGIEDLVGVFD
jgi:hypothetical protein